MCNQKRVQNENGLSLIEVLAAVVILGIFFVGFMTVLPQMTSFNVKTEDKLVAMNLAKQESAKLKDSMATLMKDDVIVSDIKDEEGNLKIKRYEYGVEEIPYNYEVDYYIGPDLDKEDSILYDSDVDGLVSLYKLHIKVKKDGKVISENFGYVQK